MGPPQYDMLDPRDKKKMMSDFELGVKPRFQYGRRNERLAIDLRGVRDDVEKSIEDETIVLNLYATPPPPLSPKSGRKPLPTNSRLVKTFGMYSIQPATM